MNNGVEHKEKGLYNVKSEMFISSLFYSNSKSYNTIINSNQFSCNCRYFIHSNHICNHLFASFYQIIEELKAPIESYVLINPFELINLIYEIKVLNRWDHTIIQFQQKFIFSRLTYIYKDIINQ